jgi:hypothetical protein
MSSLVTNSSTVINAPGIQPRPAIWQRSPRLTAGPSRANMPPRSERTAHAASTPWARPADAHQHVHPCCRAWRPPAPPRRHPRCAQQDARAGSSYLLNQVVVPHALQDDDHQIAHRLFLGPRDKGQSPRRRCVHALRHEHVGGVPVNDDLVQIFGRAGRPNAVVRGATATTEIAPGLPSTSSCVPSIGSTARSQVKLLRAKGGTPFDKGGLAPSTSRSSPMAIAAINAGARPAC